MKFFQHPEHVAICIAWAVTAGVAVISYIAIGPEEWFLVMGMPVAIAGWITFSSLRNKKRRIQWDIDNPQDDIELKAANISRKPTSERR
jgi:membrane associated rhomboid family serine protease